MEQVKRWEVGVLSDWVRACAEFHNMEQLNMEQNLQK